MARTADVDGKGCVRGDRVAGRKRERLRAMPKRPEPSPLIAAAQAFDDELQTYTRLAELFVKSPLTTTKHLDRINETLGEIAACEQRLGETGRKLVGALGAAREQQERLAAEVVGRLPAVKERNERLKGLMSELEVLGKETAAISAESGNAPRGEDGRLEVPAEAQRDLGTRILELAARAADVAAHAREAEFEELSNQAHALHQRLLAVGKKLQRPSPA
jgi:hypothetical protein